MSAVTKVHTPKRTRLRAVYLTDAERDLIVSGLGVLHDNLAPMQGTTSYEVTRFAKSFTARRIAEVIELVRGLDTNSGEIK